MKKQGSLIILLVLMVIMVFCVTGCGGNKMDSGTYLGSTGSNTFVFNKDGTCSYEEVHGDKTDKYQGTWTESGEENTYKIVLKGVNMTLFGEVSDSGVVTVTSDNSGWANEVLRNNKKKEKGNRGSNCMAVPDYFFAVYVKWKNMEGDEAVPALS